MRYVLTLLVLDRVPECEISAGDWKELEKAKIVLTNAFAIEEKYEIVLANLLDLEKEMLDVAATEVIRGSVDYPQFYAARSSLNTRVVNLLTATRLYLDQLPRHVADCVPGDLTAKDTTKSWCRHEHCQHFEYRFMDALRNYVQHRGIPIQSLTLGRSRTSSGNEYAVDIGASRTYLAQDGKFKKSVLAQIKDDTVDLKFCSRRYVESISSIHQQARDLIATAVLDARSKIEAANNRYAEVYAGNPVGLNAVALDEAGIMVSAVPMLLNWDDVRQELLKRNPKLTNFARRYVTGKSRIANE